MSLMNLVKTKKSISIFSFLLVLSFVGSCSGDDDSGEGDSVPVGQIDPPIVLDCNYFNQNPNTTLVDNPNAPVDYVVTCVMSIDNDVKIDPGVNIEFRADAGFKVNTEGSLRAAGTSSKKITFSGVEKSKGFWAGIYFDSEDSKNEISNSVVEYAGGANIGPGDRAAVKLYSNYTNTSSAKLTNNLFQFNKNFAVNLHTGKELAAIQGNTFKENDAPIRLKTESVHLLNSDNDFIGNLVNKIHLYSYASEFAGDKIWRKASVPYMLYNGSASLGFEIEGNLTVEAGTIIEMSSGSSIKIRENGSLKMVGTENDNIIIRGVEQLPGFWGRIYYSHTNSTNNILKYVKIQDAGNNPSNIKGAVYMWANPKVTAEFVEFKDVLTCAFYSAPNSPNPNLTTSNITYINTGGEICGN